MLLKKSVERLTFKRTSLTCHYALVVKINVALREQNCQKIGSERFTKSNMAMERGSHYLLKASAHSFKRLLHGFLKVSFSLSMHLLPRMNVMLDFI